MFILHSPKYFTIQTNFYFERRRRLFMTTLLPLCALSAETRLTALVRLSRTIRNIFCESWPHLVQSIIARRLQCLFLKPNIFIFRWISNSYNQQSFCADRHFRTRWSFILFRSYFKLTHSCFFSRIWWRLYHVCFRIFSHIGCIFSFPCWRWNMDEKVEN